MLRKLANSVILQQADANLAHRRKLPDKQRTNAFSELGQRQVTETCGECSKGHSLRTIICGKA